MTVGILPRTSQSSIFRLRFLFPGRIHARPTTTTHRALRGRKLTRSGLPIIVKDGKFQHKEKRDGALRPKTVSLFGGGSHSKPGELLLAESPRVAPLFIHMGPERAPSGIGRRMASDLPSRKTSCQVSSLDVRHGTGNRIRWGVQIRLLH